jgi:hypothetical protein
VYVKERKRRGWVADGIRPVQGKMVWEIKREERKKR